MTPERWQQVKEVFQAVLERDPDQWPTFLAQACGTDDLLRREVESLLESHRAAEGFLEHSAFEAATGALAEAESSQVGRRIGPYRILREIGRGGMGAVYLAARDDDQYRKEVAIKLVKRGMDTDFILRRFRHERQILANLDHPNIARLLDGGTTPEGQPYFVMEHVQGEPIDRYCGARNLSIPERLRLFRTVCAAVQHAHQQLVIHRDIKPGNILVTPEGTPTLLDFGLAKLLSPDLSSEATTATAMALHALTPEYASPEQIRGEPLSTATDVYSLGVLLYELLSGQRPYRFPSRRPDEIARTVCEQEPEKPSTTAPRLRGDLDNIVLMAMAKEPHRRYASVEQLGEDIRRYLEGLPVVARRDTWGYRSAKFVRRNRAGVVAAALVLTSLLGGMAATAWQARVAGIERARAERRFQDVRRLANSFLFELHDAIETLPGATPARELVVARALEYLDDLARDAGEGDASLQRELATAYERVGRIQGNSYYMNLGNTSGAMVSYRKALEIRERLAAADSADREIQSELADSYQAIGEMQYSMNDLTGGLRSYERALAIREALSAKEPANVAIRRALAAIHTRLGDVKGLEGFPNLGDTEGALEHYQKALSLYEGLAAADLQSREARAVVGQTLSHVGILLRVTGDARGAVEHGRAAVRLFDSLSVLEPDNTEHRFNLLSSYLTLRFALVDDGQLAEAIGNTRQTIAILEAMTKADPRNAFARRGLGVSHNALGTDLLAVGDAAGALESFGRALAISEGLVAADSTSGENRRDVAFTLQRMAEAQAASGNFRAALGSYRRALEIQKALFAASPLSAGDRDDLAISYAGVGNMLAALGNPSGALEALRRAVTLAQEASGTSPSNVEMRARLAQRYFELGRVHEQLARSAAASGEREANRREACGCYQRSHEVWQDMRGRGILRRADAEKREEAARVFDRCKRVFQRDQVSASKPT